MAAHADKKTVSNTMGAGWRTVGRVVVEVQAGADGLANLRRIGIDEISFRKRHKYLVLVVDRQF